MVSRNTGFSDNNVTASMLSLTISVWNIYFGFDLCVHLVPLVAIYETYWHTNTAWCSHGSKHSNWIHWNSSIFFQTKKALSSFEVWKMETAQSPEGFQDRCNMSMVLSCKQKTVKDSSLLLLTCALVLHLFIFQPGNLTDLREGTLYPILGIWTAVPISNARCQR